MRRVRAFFIRIAGIFGKSKRDRELSAELESHLQLHIDDNLRAGMSPPEARRRAIIKLGGIESTKESYRDRRSIPIIETTLQDIRYGARSLVKNPGFTAVALLSLTLGIGANATIFTLVKAVFLQSIPVKDSSRAIVVYSTQQNADGKILEFQQSSYLNAQDYRERNDVFSGLSMYMDVNAEMERSGSARPQFAHVQLVDWDFFDILQVSPISGRTFTADEDRVPDARPVAVLSYGFWNTRLGADPNILGKTIRLYGLDYNVIGVMPKEFKHIGTLGSPEVWAPMMMHEQVVKDARKSAFAHRRSWVVYMIGRLKPGLSLSRATTSLHRLGDQLAEAYPADNSGRNVELVPLSETNVPPAQRHLFVLAGTLMMGIVGLVLLIACGNVANLLLARAMQRRHEFAIRLSLGACRWRLIRQMLTESLLLGVTSAVLGILCAYWARNLLWALLPSGRPAGLDISLDGRVLLFTLGVSIAATLLFGLAPSLQASNPRQMSALRDHADTLSGTSRWYGLRGVLVIAQITFSLTALMVSALFIHSLRNAQDVDPGFETKRGLTVFLNPGSEHYPQERAEQYYRDATEKVRALPMVVAAGISNTEPFELSLMYTLFPEGVDVSDPRNGSRFPVIAVSPGYFSAARIPLLRGRDVTDRDDAQTDHVIVINQALADYFWKNQNPIGKRLSFVGQSWKAEVVGIVGTVKTQSLGEPPQPVLYFPLSQMFFPSANLYVRTEGDPGAAIPSISAALQPLDPAMPPRRIETITSILDQLLTGPRFAAELLAGFGALALVLASIGTYGVMAYSVRQRTQEIGIRVAVGAQRGDVLRLILGNGMAMVLAGVAVGLGVTAVFTRSISTLLYGIGNFDAISFFASAIVLIAVALVACWLPARRAMRVDPMVALRHE